MTFTCAFKCVNINYRTYTCGNNVIGWFWLDINVTLIWFQFPALFLFVFVYIPNEISLFDFSFCA